MFERGSHCSYCGSKYLLNSTWPKTCNKCENISYRNPLPVTVVLLPIVNDLENYTEPVKMLVIRRGIEPGLGKLALAGGYVNWENEPEIWQKAAARELFEETNILIDPNEFQEYRVVSVPSGSLLIFAETLSFHTVAELPKFIPNEEVQERLLLSKKDLEALPSDAFAFPTHSDILYEYLEELESTDL